MGKRTEDELLERREDVYAERYLYLEDLGLEPPGEGSGRAGRRRHFVMMMRMILVLSVVVVAVVGCRQTQGTCSRIR